MGIIKEAALQLKLVDLVSGPAKAVSATLEAVNGAINRFNANRRAANAAFRGAAFEAVALGAALVQPIRAAARLEEAMADVQKVSGLSDKGLAGLRNRLIQLSRETPMAADELAGLAAELAAAGTPDEELERMTALVARVGVAYGMTGAEAGENLGKIRAALNLTVEETERYADSINALSDGTASNAKDLTDFSRRVGSLGKQYGFTNEQVLAFGSSMISAGATSETAATGFQAVGRALVRGQSATAGQTKAFKRLGLTSAAVAKGMAKDALGTTEDVFRRIRELPQHERGAIVNALFGDEAKTAIALIENTNLLSDSLKILADEGLVAGSVMREFQTRIGTTTGKLKQLRNRAMAAGIALGNALLPSIKDGADALGPMIDRTSRFIETNQEMVKRLTLTAAGMVGLRLAATGARAAMYAMLRPTNLLIAGLGYLAYQNFDQIAGSLGELRKVATDLAGTQFAQSFIKGAREGLEGMATAARELAGYLASVSAEGTRLRNWLDSVAGADWGETLGKVAIGLGAIGATAGALATVAGPLRAIARAALWLSGIKPALGLLRFLRGLKRSSADVASVADDLNGLATTAATAGDNVGRRFGTSLASAAKGVIGRAGLGAYLLTELVASIPDSAEELQRFMEEKRKRSESWNQWLEDNVGTPRSWLGLDQPKTPEPVVDHAKAGRQQAELADTTKAWPFAAQQGMRDFVQAVRDGGADAERLASMIASDIRDQLQIAGNADVNTDALERALGLGRELAATLRGVPAVGAPYADTSAAQAAVDQLQAQLSSATATWPEAAAKSMADYVSVIAADGTGAKQEADRVGRGIAQALTVEGRPTVDTSQLQHALSLARELAAAIRSVGTASVPAPATMPKFGGPRALGGPVKRGVTYLVGEKRPELFTPNENGKIVPRVPKLLGDRGPERADASRKRGADAQPAPSTAASVGQVVSSPKFENHFHFNGTATKNDAMEILRALDRQLNRSEQVVFGALRPYGDY